MVSIFWNFDKTLQGKYKFWMPFIPNKSRILFRGRLSEISRSGRIEEREYLLSESHLIRISPDSLNSHKMVPIQWKIVVPFIEDNTEIKRFGITIGHQTASKDFYALDERFLDIWIENLSSVCIMNDLSDDYTLIKEIGHGSFAKVFLAINQKDLKKYAVKSIKKEKIIETDEKIHLLINEIMIMRKLDHPNLVKIHRVYESDQNIHLILDYAAGDTLYNRIISKKSFTENDVRKIATKMLEILAYLESNRIVHRDIKLENILLVSNENDHDFKLCDFGLATEIDGELTLRCGTPGYVAPEVLLKQPYCNKVDVFSLGVIIYILLCGKMPFYGHTTNDVLIKNRDCKIYFSADRWNSHSPDSIDFLTKILDADQYTRLAPSEAIHHPWLQRRNTGISTTKKSTHPAIQNEGSIEELGSHDGQSDRINLDKRKRRERVLPINYDRKKVLKILAHLKELDQESCEA